jgi:hypothetical protein
MAYFPLAYALATDHAKHVGAMLGAMLNDPMPFLIKPRTISD